MTKLVASQLLRTSERRDIKRCPQRWYWAWVDGLRPMRDANPLWFGTGIHIALADWYQLGAKRGPHPAKTWQKFAADEHRFIPTDYEEDGVKYTEAVELGTIMLNGYVDLYKKDPDWDVIATEQTFQLLIPKIGHTRRPTRLNALLEYLGTFDGVYRSRKDGTLWLMEHKTAKGIDLRHLPLDDQAGSYWFVASKVLQRAGLIRPTEEIVGIMYNILRKGVPDDRPVNDKGIRLNKDGSESKRQPPPLYHREPVWRSKEEQSTMLRRIQDESIYKQQMIAGITPVFKNPTRDCAWDCSFYKMCMLHEANGDWEEFREMAFTKSDPYSDHRANRKNA